LVNSNFKLEPDTNTGNVSLNRNADQIWQSDTGAIYKAGGGTNWTLVLVDNGSPTENITIDVVVWYQAGGCTSPGSGVVLASKAGQVVVPITDGHGYSMTLTGSGAAVHTFGATDRLCMEITNHGGDGVGAATAEQLTFRTSVLSTNGAGPTDLTGQLCRQSAGCALP
jgi:hypothetical protein